MSIADLMNSPAGLAIIGGVFAFITAVFTELLRRQHNALKAVRETSDAVREQTQNSHKTNLRDDLDEVIAGVRQLLLGQDRHTEEIANLRVDAAWERRERMDLAKRVDLIASR